MGFSNDGHISFGYCFSEGYKFPWDAEPFNGDLEYWWRHVKDYTPPFKLYGPDGEYAPGIELLPSLKKYDKPKPKQEVIDAYYDPLLAWDKEHPVPVVLVNYCSGDYPMYIYIGRAG